MGTEEKNGAESRTNKLLVFLAWSGPASQKVASVLYDHLPLIINAVEPYMSDEDVEKGTRWVSEISRHLEACGCGVLCITPENLKSQWMHFEAGALSKVIDKSLVCPFLVGVKQSSLKGPLTMFQATASAKNDFYRLVKTLNSQCGQLGLKDDRLQKAFEVYWPKIGEALSAIEGELNQPASPTGAAKEAVEPEERELIDELVVRVRDLSRNLPEMYSSLLKEICARGRRHSIADLIIERQKEEEPSLSPREQRNLAAGFEAMGPIPHLRAAVRREQNNGISRKSNVVRDDNGTAE